MRPLLSKTRQFLILFAVNGVIIFVLLYCFEAYLRLTDPFLKLPFDSFYYRRYADYYPQSKAPTEVDYTWGHPVINNRLGFREREFETPKPAGLCRVMVLGDSLTWGVGLSPEERYTYVAETYLNESFKDRKFEVLNFGVSGLPTTIERDILKDYKDLVTPDLVVIGYVYNDTQPKSQGYVLEREQFNEKYGYWLRLGPQALLQMGLPQLARLSSKATDYFLVFVGLVPPWQVGVQRTYEQNSAEWQAFRQALLDIRAMSDEMKLPPPIFTMLNSDIYPDSPSLSEEADGDMSFIQRWFQQAGQTATEIGFVIYDHEQELRNQFQPYEVSLNALDAHPSAKVNEVYGSKLFETIAVYMKNRQLCAPISPQTPQPALAEPLANKRLMEIKMGDKLRFLGYTADNPRPGRGEMLRLAFGWQALAQIKASYIVHTYLLGKDGTHWAENETQPCHGDCPTIGWPPGMTAPPGSSTIYWPVAAEMQPLPLERVFDLSHLKYRDASESTLKIVPLPLSMIPFPGSLIDEHVISLSPQLATGEYTLLMALVDPLTGEALPAYDEVASAWLPDAQVVLGQIVVH